MKLRIESPGAKREGYSGAARRQSPATGGCLLNLAMNSQEQQKWCWAALAASLGRYYRTLSWPQHRVVSVLLGFDCSRFRDDEDVRARCDVYAMLDDALRIAGCYSHWSPGRPSFERIRTEIEAGRPVCVQIDWRRGGSHYVALTGYYPDRREIYIQDPLHGPSVQTFDNFPRSYRLSGGAWNGTFWTHPPGAANPKTELREEMRP
jgi:hypothetical protein